MKFDAGGRWYSSGGEAACLSNVSVYYSVAKFSSGNGLENYLSCFVVSVNVGFFEIFASAGHVHASSDLATWAFIGGAASPFVQVGWGGRISSSEFVGRICFGSSELAGQGGLECIGGFTWFGIQHCFCVYGCAFCCAQVMCKVELIFKGVV